MYLQGNLQAVFDALYNLGVIDPVLDMDWNQALNEMDHHADDFFKVLAVANYYQNDVQSLMQHLEKFDHKTLSYLAMEVAREFADYHSRDSLH